MAFEITPEFRAVTEQGNIQGNIILEIEGIDKTFGLTRVSRVARIGEFVIGDGTLIGGVTEDQNSLGIISEKGTSLVIQQKLNQEGGGASSVQTFKLRLLDESGYLTDLFSPGNVVSDILGVEATVYFQPQQTRHPQDSVRIFQGSVSTADFGQAYIDLVISHPEQLKRQDLFIPATTTLSAAITDSSTTILVEDNSDFIVPQAEVEAYLSIGDELIKVNQFGTNSFPLAERGQFKTIAEAHEEGDEVTVLYRLCGNAIDLALGLMLSGGDEEYFAEETATRMVQVDALESIPRAIYFDEANIQDKLGLVVGDFISIQSGANASNLVGYTPILSFGQTDVGSYIVTAKELVSEVDIEARCLFKSKYSTLPEGCGIKPYQLDVAEFENLKARYSSQIFSYKYPIKDKINAKDFIDSKLLYPSGFFSLPRKGRISAGVFAAPLAGVNSKTLSISNIKNPENLKMSRTVNKNFYNHILFKFNEDMVEDKFLSNDLTQSADSLNRVKNARNKVLEIEAGGIEDTPSNRVQIERIARRLLDRYQYGAESVVIDTNFSTGFEIEVGDSLTFEGSELGVADITQGNRNFNPRVMEVIDKTISLKDGNTRLVCLDSNLGSGRRYASFSPSSLVGTGSTSTEIVIKRSFGTIETEIERDKWSDYLLQKITIRDKSFTNVYEGTLASFKNSNSNILVVTPAVGFSVTEDMIVECPDYDDSSVFAMRLWKAKHGFFNPQVEVVSATTNTLTVASGDVDKFLVGKELDIHSPDYTERDSAKIDSIAGDTLTLNKTLNFTPDSTTLIDLIGFKDGGSAYSYY